MDELKFVMKCLILACLIFSASQYESDGVTIEAKVHNYLVSSPVASFVNESARGAVKLIREGQHRFLNQPSKKVRRVKASEKVESFDTEDIDLD